MAAVSDPNKYGTLSEQDVSAFEQDIGNRLPEDYRQFLLENNGGHVEPAVFTAGEFGDSVVNFFYGIPKKRSDNWNIRVHNQYLRHAIPEGTIAIGCDPFGNAILLGVEGQKKGEVWFWFHEGTEDDDGDYFETYRCADSFTDFWNSLRENDEVLDPNDYLK